MRWEVIFSGLSLAFVTAVIVYGSAGLVAAFKALPEFAEGVVMEEHRNKFECDGFRVFVWVRADNRWQAVMERRTQWGWTGVTGVVGSEQLVVDTLLSDDRWGGLAVLEQVEAWHTAQTCHRSVL
jgi:hypothetical protein